MSSKDLQRVTVCVSDIGQGSRRFLPTGRNHITLKVRIADQRTLYLSVPDDPSPAEIILRGRGTDCTLETIALYDVIARLMSVAFQYGASLEKQGALLTGAQFAPCGPVSGQDRLSQCFILSDLIGRHLLVDYCGRDEMTHVPETTTKTSLTKGVAGC